jgi:hypothetical protein
MSETAHIEVDADSNWQVPCLGKRAFSRAKSYALTGRYLRKAETPTYWTMWSHAYQDARMDETRLV